jgi:hypothetical protein
MLTACQGCIFRGGGSYQLISFGGENMKRGKIKNKKQNVKKTGRRTKDKGERKLKG